MAKYLRHLPRRPSPLELESLDVTFGVADIGMGTSTLLRKTSRITAISGSTLGLSSESCPGLSALEAIKHDEPGAASQTELVRLLALLLGVAR